MNCCICDKEMGKFSMSGFHIDVETGVAMYFCHWQGIILRIFKDMEFESRMLEKAWCYDHLPIEHKYLSGWGFTGEEK